MVRSCLLCFLSGNHLVSGQSKDVANFWLWSGGWRPRGGAQVQQAALPPGQERPRLGNLTTFLYNLCKLCRSDGLKPYLQLQVSSPLVNWRRVKPKRAGEADITNTTPEQANEAKSLVPSLQHSRCCGLPKMQPFRPTPPEYT